MLGEIKTVADPETFLKSVILSYDVMPEPGSDRYLTDTRERNGLLLQIAGVWADIVGGGKIQDDFPWSDTFVLRAWVKWRKTSEEDKHLTRVLLGIE